MDIDIRYRPSPSHFRLSSRFELEGGKAEYEYKIDGTDVSIRLLNSYDNGESTEFKDEWDVRDGVVLESDLRSRWEEKKYKWGSIDEKIADLKAVTEWKILQSCSFNGFKYYVLNRALPAPDARRYLRQELERLKLGNARAVQEIAKYGLEPDPSPKSTDGWRWIGGQKPDGADTQPFWDEVKTGKFGVTYEEIGRSGKSLILNLQLLLGDAVKCKKCDEPCLNTDKFCASCGQKL